MTLDEYGGPVEADFRRFYHRGLYDSLRELGCREVWNMVRYLPQDAALWRVQEQQQPSKPDPGELEFGPGTDIRTDDFPTIQRWFNQAIG